MSEVLLYGLVAEFREPHELVAAAAAAVEAGYRDLDGYSPFPVEGLAEALAVRPSPVPLLALAGGLVGSFGAFGIQTYATMISYAHDIGGRPAFSWPSFILPSFASGILGAGVCAVLGMMLLNRLPRLHHPIFEHDRFHLASRDRFFLRLGPDRSDFDEAAAERWLEGRNPLSIRRLAR